MKRTPLFDRHVALGARMVDFSGWEMPLHYGSQLREHHAVRQECGLFDVSHMGVVDLEGTGVDALLAWLLANDVGRIPTPGQGQYGVMLNIKGGIADDLIAYRLAAGRFFLVVNAGTREKDLAWIRVHAPSYGVTVRERRDLCVLALQGPDAAAILGHCLFEGLMRRVHDLKPFHFITDNGWRIARTGYTGEDGYELMVPEAAAGALWDGLLRAGAAPVGLGARDTLRLEAGLNLYGHDMDEQTTPMASGLAWTVAWDPAHRDFIGRQALEPLWDTPSPFKRMGLVLEEKGVLRDHQEVFCAGKPVGTITSGGYSPTLERGIALARLAASVKPGDRCEVAIRNRRLPARAVRPPFVRNGRAALRD